MEETKQINVEAIRLRIAELSREYFREFTERTIKEPSAVILARVKELRRLLGEPEDQPMRHVT